MIPETGTISFSDIQNEFGGEHPISLSEYYKDSPSEYTKNVPNFITLGNPNKLHNFRGKTKSVLKTVTLQTGTFDAIGVHGQWLAFNAPPINLPSDYNDNNLVSWDLYFYSTNLKILILQCI